MFSSWGTAISRFRWLVLALAVAFLAVAGVWGIGVFGKMSGSSSLNDPASESQRINQQVLADFGPQSQDIVALYSSTTATVTDPRFAEAVRAAEARAHGLAGIAAITSYYDTQSPSFVSTDKHETYIAVRLAAHTSDGKANKIAKALRTSAVPGTTDVKTLIDNRCVVCHRAPGSSFEPALDNGAAAAAVAGDIKSEVASSAMPADGSRLSDDDKNALINWVNCGAKQ